MSAPGNAVERDRPVGESPPIAASFAAMALAMVAVFGGASLMLGPAMGYLPKPYGWILGAQIGLPWLGAMLVWCFPRYYSLFSGRARWGASRDRRLGLFWMFFPTFFTFFGYYDLATLTDRGPMIPWALSAGAAMLIGGAWRDPYLWAGGARRHPGTLLIAVLLSGFYGYAAVLQLDIVLDRSPDVVAQLSVAGKILTNGSRSLQVEPWGTRGSSQHVPVSPDVFRATSIGGPVCVVQRAGALGAPWYTAQTCPWSGGPVDLENGGSL